MERSHRSVGTAVVWRACGRRGGGGGRRLSGAPWSRRPRCRRTPRRRPSVTIAASSSPADPSPVTLSAGCCTYRPRYTFRHHHLCYFILLYLLYLYTCTIYSSFECCLYHIQNLSLNFFRAFYVKIIVEDFVLT